MESEDDEPTIGPTKASRGRKAAPVSVFELLGEEDEGSGAEGEEEEAAEEEEVAEEEEGKGATDETPELRPVPIVAKIVGLKQHPKADRLRVVKLAAGPLLGDVQVVTNAPNLTKQQLVALAVRRGVWLGRVAGAPPQLVWEPPACGALPLHTRDPGPGVQEL